MATVQAAPIKNEQDELRSAYNSAFEKWVSEVTLLQSYAADPSATVEHIANARVRIQRAQSEYRERRNQLLRRMASRRDPKDK
jgi:hypothetical protein